MRLARLLLVAPWLLVGCASDPVEPDDVEEGALGLVVGDPEEAEALDDLVLAYDPTVDGEHGPIPVRAHGGITAQGQLQLVLPEGGPAMDLRRQIEDPEVGLVTNPDSPWVGIAVIWSTTPNAVDNKYSDLRSQSEGAYTGGVEGAQLLYTPVDLETLAGVPGFGEAADALSAAAGWHLYILGEERPLETPLTITLKSW